MSCPRLTGVQTRRRGPHHLLDVIQMFMLSRGLGPCGAAVCTHTPSSCATFVRATDNRPPFIQARLPGSLCSSPRRSLQSSPSTPATPLSVHHTGKVGVSHDIMARTEIKAMTWCRNTSYFEVHGWPHQAEHRRFPACAPHGVQQCRP